MGRIRRRDYLLASIIIGGIQFFIYLYLETISIDDIYWFLLIVSLVLVIIGISYMVRRLHDINLSGWLAIFSIIPLLNLAFIALFFIDGTVGPNKYGDDPKKRKKRNIDSETTNTKTTESTQKKLQINTKDNYTKKLILLDESLEIGIIDKYEYENKKSELLKSKLKKEEQEKEQKRLEEEALILKSKKSKLEDLWKDGLLTQQEYKSKLDLLNDQDLNVQRNKAIDNPDDRYYFVSKYQEYGPYTASEIKKIVNKADFNIMCLVRSEFDKTYTSGLRIVDIIGDSDGMFLN